MQTELNIHDNTTGMYQLLLKSKVLNEDDIETAPTRTLVSKNVFVPLIILLDLQRRVLMGKMESRYEHMVRRPGSCSLIETCA